jgi:hypothetical protein
MRLRCSVAIFTIYWNFVKFLTHRRLMASRPQIMTSVCRKLNKVDIPLFFKIYFRFSKQKWFFYCSRRLRDRVTLERPGRQSTDVAFRVCHTPLNHILTSNLLLINCHFFVAQLPDYYGHFHLSTRGPKRGRVWLRRTYWILPSFYKLRCIQVALRLLLTETQNFLNYLKIIDKNNLESW